MLGKISIYFYYFLEKGNVVVPNFLDKSSSLDALERHLSREFIETG